MQVTRNLQLTSVKRKWLREYRYFARLFLRFRKKEKKTTQRENDWQMLLSLSSNESLYPNVCVSLQIENWKESLDHVPRSLFSGRVSRSASSESTDGTGQNVNYFLTKKINMRLRNLCSNSIQQSSNFVQIYISSFQCVTFIFRCDHIVQSFTSV